MRGSPALCTTLTTILTGLLTAGLLGTALLATAPPSPARTVTRGPGPPPPSTVPGRGWWLRAPGGTGTAKAAKTEKAAKADAREAATPEKAAMRTVTLACGG
jgi:hypothetical protein